MGSLATNTSENVEVINHPTLFFPDGDIIISCHNKKQQEVHFKVDKVLLARSSLIFQDMLAIPLPD
ncbi:hypothetical protein C8Q75DRAFT_62892 [Abortiporus biennis]|nr:hypothetical protein C8Q75DRAFT_62892 [Abortiporus biennis]